MNALKNFLNWSERDDKIFVCGLIVGSIFSTTLIIQMCNVPDYVKFVSNNLIIMKRSKLISRKNNFYFENDIGSKTIENFQNFMNQLEPNEPVNLYFDTYGGLFSVAQMICNIILNHKGETNAIILNKSFSAGTLCALCCKNIYMHPNAFLSPVDVIHNNLFSTTQLTSIKNVVKNKNADKIEDSTYIMDDQATKSKTILNKIFEKICLLHNFDNSTKSKVFEEIFQGEKYTHSTVFSYEDLCSFGIDIKPITKEMETMSKLILKANKKH